MKNIFKHNKAKNRVLKIASFIELEAFRRNISTSPINLSGSGYPSFFIWDSINSRFLQIEEKDIATHNRGSKEIYSLKDVISRKRRWKLVNDIKKEIRQARLTLLNLKNNVSTGTSVRLGAMIQSERKKVSVHLSYLYASLSLLNFDYENNHGKRLYDVINFLNRNFKGSEYNLNQGA